MDHPFEVVFIFISTRATVEFSPLLMQDVFLLALLVTC